MDIGAYIEIILILKWFDVMLGKYCKNKACL